MATERRFRVTGISFLFFCLSLFLTAYSAKNPRFASVGTAALNEAQRPVQSVIVGGFGSIRSVWDNYLGLMNLRKEYSELEEKIKVLELDKAKLLETEEENGRLKKLLNVVQEANLPVVTARVIAYDPSNWVQAVTINRGSRDGVQTGMAVISSDGVVGQVVAAGFTSSKVTLITDHSSGVDALLQNSRVRGIVEGAGRKSLRWRFVLEEDEIRIGERLVTSGMDGVYPPGLFIGRVSDFERSDAGMFQRVDVSPAVNMARLEEVLIVTTPQEIQKVTTPERKK